jgi:hypothetical protein
MILPMFLFVAIGCDLPPVFVDRPKLEIYNLAHPSPRAVQEHAQTLAARHDFHARRSAVRAEREALWSIQDAPAMPLPQGPSTGQTPIVINVYNQTPMYMPTSSGNSGVPACAGQLPPMWREAYARIFYAMGGN